jgi:hypothetical protein
MRPRSEAGRQGSKGGPHKLLTPKTRNHSKTPHCSSSHAASLEAQPVSADRYPGADVGSWPSRTWYHVCISVVKRGLADVKRSALKRLDFAAQESKVAWTRR